MGARLTDTVAAIERRCVPEHRDGLIACADREDTIADLAQAMFPASEEENRALDPLAQIAIDSAEYLDVLLPSLR